jgi:glucan 1,3-beta-glucosidase
MEQWRGVNLGGWLVLEKWMTPSLFDGRAAIDEYGLCQELGPAKAPKLLDAHRASFITETDFAWIAEHGLNAVRLPVGWWVFGNEPPYVGAIAYVDRAFEWARKYGLQVVLDLHGAPGSQNGNDHSGKAGRRGWGSQETIKQTLDVLEKLATRYGGNSALAAMEILNEPSYRLGRRRLSGFYEQAYARVRKRCDRRVAIIFHDAFRPKRWSNVLRGPSFERVMLDHHYYQVFGWRDRRRLLRRQLSRPQILAERIASVQLQRPVIVGEWSLALPNRAMQSSDATTHKGYADAQLLAMRAARGWFFWSYKTEGGGVWSYRDCVQRGWLPAHFGDQP